MHNALNTLQELVRRYPDGMLPEHACKRCGADLGAVYWQLARITKEGL